MAKIHAEPPNLIIHEFNGVLSWKKHFPLTVENILWSGTVIATGEIIGCVVYTGSDTRMVMNTKKPRYKFGLVDREINNLTKLLSASSATLALILVALRGFDRVWYRYFIRYILVFSYMISISLQVNMDLAKLVYSWFIQQDKEISDSVTRTSTIPEELVRVGYLLADKTGTLTKNIMTFKRLKIGHMSHTLENKTKISNYLRELFRTTTIVSTSSDSVSDSHKQPKLNNYTEANKIVDAIKALALCHNVTPVLDEPLENDSLRSTTDTPRTSITSIHTSTESEAIELLSSKG